MADAVPGPSPGSEPPAGERVDLEQQAGQVVDRAVLAERRALRAELGEQASTRRAAAAKTLSEALEVELRGLEQRLEGVEAARREALERLAERERSLRAAVQRLHAEQRRREEAAEEATRRVIRAEAEAQDARRQAVRAQTQTAELRRDVEELRRRAAEAENALGAAVHARRRAEAEAATSAERMRELANRRAEALAAQARLADTAPCRPVLAGEMAAMRSTLTVRMRSSADPPPPIGLGPVAAALERERRQRPPAADAARAVGPDLTAVEAVLAEARETVAGARKQMAQLERARDEQAVELEELRRQLEQRIGGEQHAHALLDELHEQVRRLHRRGDERMASRDATRRLLVEWLAGARSALEDAERRIAAALGAANEAEEALEHERGLRAGIERALEREVARRWAAEQRASRNPGEDHDQPDQATMKQELRQQATALARAEWRADEMAAQLADLRRRVAASARPPNRAGHGPGDPWLARGLRLLAREDPVATTRLLLGLLASHGPAVGRRVEYDIEVEGVGTHTITSSPDGVQVAQLAASERASRPAFRLKLEAPALVELLVLGGPAGARATPGVRVLGTRRRRRALRALPAVCLDPAELEARGAWLDPALCMRTLTLLIDPTWTRGHRFVLAQELDEEGQAPWYVRIDDGIPPRVTEVPPPDGPTASVRLSRGGFQRLLAGDHAPGEKASIRGDARAVAALAQWVRWARTGRAPAAV